MKHIQKITKPKVAQVETTGLTWGQILTLIANILSVIAQALTAKEQTSTT
ncbi:MAG: hypothetical protein N3G21_00745 [Candidatus Hydrogenedentes bacterium]|nr:hypothetical protein [Candidatus Hydrogenedentota bacterium]